MEDIANILKSKSMESINRITEKQNVTSIEIFCIEYVLVLVDSGN